MRAINSVKNVRFLNTRAGFIVSMVVAFICFYAGIYFGLR